MRPRLHRYALFETLNPPGASTTVPRTNLSPSPSPTVRNRNPSFEGYRPKDGESRESVYRLCMPLPLDPLFQFEVETYMEVRVFPVQSSTSVVSIHQYYRFRTQCDYERHESVSYFLDASSDELREGCDEHDKQKGYHCKRSEGPVRFGNVSFTESNVTFN